MPFRNQHSCMINDKVTNNLKSRRAKTQFGEIWVVVGVGADGKEHVRSIRFPASVPVNTAASLCRQRGGKFVAATPSDPKQQLMSEEYGFTQLSKYTQKVILRSLIESFEMPGYDVQLAKWKSSSVNDLPDSAFLIILPGGKKDKEGKTVPRSKRLLPYKNASGQIDKAHVRNAMARINQTHAPASMKKTALAKLIRVAKALGMDVQERKKFKLSDMEFYLSLLEGLEKLDATSDTQ
jgi:hypothetical protein